MEQATRRAARLASRDDDTVSQLAEMFRLMGDPTRLRVILSCLPGPSPVGDMARRLGLSSSLVSHHLRLLRAARVLRGQRRGKQVYYGLADQHISRVLLDMLDHVAEPASQGAHSAPRRERRGAKGPPQADAGGLGRSPI